VLDHYRDPVAALSLVATSLLLAYGGGAVLFWFHAIYLGEAGPSLIPVMHWAVDSTLGFLALTPPLALLLPLALRKAEHPRTGVVPPWRFALIAGTAFTIVTAPGPLVHDATVGQGKWLAARITLLLTKHLGSWVFRRPGAGPEAEVPWLANVLLQVDVGWPTYVLLLRFSHRLHTTAGGAGEPPHAARGPVRAMAGAAPSQPPGALAGGAALIASLIGQSSGQHGSRGANHDGLGLGGVPAYYDIPNIPAAAPAPANSAAGAGGATPRLPGPGGPIPSPRTPPASTPPTAPPPPPPWAPAPTALPLGPLQIPERVWQPRRRLDLDPDVAGPADWPLDPVDTGQWLAARAAVEPGSQDDLDVDRWLQQLEADW
jgi:hypothetical protein